MRRVWTFWLTTGLTGGAMIALPDTGPRLFSISRTHGPSAVDAAGAVILLAGWIALDVAIVRRRGRLRMLPSSARATGLAVMLGGIALLVPSLLLDWGAWWVPAVAMIGGVQIAAAFAVGRDTRATRPARAS